MQTSAYPPDGGHSIIYFNPQKKLLIFMNSFLKRYRTDSSAIRRIADLCLSARCGHGVISFNPQKKLLIFMNSFLKRYRTDSSAIRRIADLCLSAGWRTRCHFFQPTKKTAHFHEQLFKEVPNRFVRHPADCRPLPIRRMAYTVSFISTHKKSCSFS
ncbi:MAG: hypothetical protein WDO19_33360 [Bacteroidota bacterium]